MKRLSILTLAIAGCILALFLILGCEAKDESEQPTIPALSTMTMDLSDFDTTEVKAAATKSKSPEMCHHFRNAAGAVLIWRAITTVALVPPALVFALALSQEAELQADGTWLWSYSAPVEGETYTARLIADPHIAISEVDWYMRVTGGEFDNFEWFNGRCNFDATEGYWQFYDKDASGNRKQTLKLDWAREGTEFDKELEFINNDTTNAGYLDSLTYKVADPYCYMKIVDVSEDKNFQVECDTTTGAGQISYAEGDSTGCWDTDRNCIECPYTK